MGIEIHKPGKLKDQVLNSVSKINLRAYYAREPKGIRRRQAPTTW